MVQIIETETTLAVDSPNYSMERRMRFLRSRPALRCPTCLADLIDGPSSLICVDCSASYPVRDHRVFFIASPEMNDNLDILKHRLKHLLGRFYYTIGIAVVAPTFPFDYRAAIRRHLDPSKQLVVDIGAGNHRIDPNIVTVDLFDYPSIDIICDLARLPFRDKSVDAFVSRSVLEHVPDLTNISRGLANATRTNGLGLHLIPFLFPFHASPHDYQRLTHIGAARLFPGFELVEQRNVTGPFTLLTLLVTEFLAIVFSFGHERLKAPLYLLFCLMLFPLKFLDFPFIGRSSMLGLAPTILTVSRKVKDQ